MRTQAQQQAQLSAASFTQLLMLLAACYSALASEDPDTHRTICGIVEAKGHEYRCSIDNVTTPDGYILQSFHIVNDNVHTADSPSILLWHGLMDNAFSWVMNLPGQSLTYLLADKGYNVWLGNSRGTIYGLGHTHLDPAEAPFWQFTWDQFAHSDVPATIKHIKASSNPASKVGYIGHSQGTIQMFAALSSRSVNPADLAFNIAMGPVIVASHQTDPVWTVLSDHVAVWLGRAVDKKEFTIPAIIKPFVDAACLVIPRMCQDYLELFVGKAMNLNESRVEVMVAHEPGGTSTLNLAHWGQLVRTGQFGAYDFGHENPKHYNGSATAPLYTITAYPSEAVPTAILSGSDDVLADPQDVQILVRSLPFANTTLVKEINGYGHMDFMWDPNAVTKVYLPFVLPFVKAHLQFLP